MSEAQMKVMIFGRQTTVKKIASALISEEVEVVSIAPGVNTVEAVEQCEDANLALIDTQAEDMKRVCHYVNRVGIPILLIVNQKQAEWERFDSLQTQGYLLDTTKNGELMARLTAAARSNNGGKGEAQR
jgi:DNA-binding response OmpR family regulator